MSLISLILSPLIGIFFIFISFAFLTPVDSKPAPSAVPQLEKFTFGFQPAVADSFWLQALQSFEICNSNERECPQNTPTFQILAQASRLAPDMRMLNHIAPMMLSVVSSDVKGASYLFDRAVMLFPNDWEVLYRASYHALFEEKDKEKAAGLMKRAAGLGAPTWLYSMATMLYTEAGREEFANQMVLDLKRQGVSQDIIDLVEKAKTEKRPGSKVD